MEKSILFVGQCYYNAWYLSRELRKKGWKADVLNIDGDLTNKKKFYHGEDYLFRYKKRRDLFRQLWFFFRAMRKYSIFHFSNAHGMWFTQSLDQYVNNKDEHFKLSYKYIYFLFDKIFRWNSILVSFSGLLCLALFNEYVFEFIERMKIYIPSRWDIKLIKKVGKKITYANNGCLDGVSQTSFRKWKPFCVCEDCIWKERPDVCSDERNLAWGEFRNKYADFQIMLCGNRADYNLAPKIHEVPGYYCLDEEFWKPNLIIPGKFKIEKKNKTLLYHAVGNFEMRTDGGSQRNIKSTHIYLPLVDQLKREGYNIELIFAKNIPNKEVRFLMVQADIVLDMLTVGFFGATAREGMMLGKPVVCYLRPAWLENMRKEIPEYVDELPVISATPETVQGVLKDLIENPDKRKEIGRRSREFAVKWHSAQAGANSFEIIYASLMSNEIK